MKTIVAGLPGIVWKFINGVVWMEILLKIIAVLCLCFSAYKSGKYVDDKNIAGVINYSVWIILFSIALMRF